MSIRAELETIRERVEAATKGPWMADADDPRQIRAGEDEYWLASMRGDTASRRKDAEFIAHARTDLPRLLDAVEKVLELHKPMGATDEVFCSACFDPDWTSPDDNNYPCATVRAISTALEGK